MPCPNPIVIVAICFQFEAAGACGCAASGNSMPSLDSIPIRSIHNRCFSPPTASAIRAAPILDEYATISGTYSQRCLPPSKSLIVNRPIWIGA